MIVTNEELTKALQSLQDTTIELANLESQYSALHGMILRARTARETARQHANNLLAQPGVLLTVIAALDAVAPQAVVTKEGK